MNYRRNHRHEPPKTLDWPVHSKGQEEGRRKPLHMDSATVAAWISVALAVLQVLKSVGLLHF